jgi:HTH-type transcriptional regulator, transcriptional repressor of NAD biosynthesis genes
MTYRHALVVGKFYPPTLGHHALIRYAARHADRVTVVVMTAAQESISLDDRVSWLQAEHLGDSNVTAVGIRCDIPTDLGSATIWTAQVALMRAAVSSVTTQPIDLVVSSEPYGPPLAERLGCASLPFDPDRQAVRVSATDVRADLPGHWHLLSGPVRAGLAVRVVVVGAQSTGTTTIAGLLAERFRARGGVWARTQLVDDYDREDAAAALGSPLLVCENDALPADVRDHRHLGQLTASEQPPVLPRRSLYLVTDHEGVPRESDGAREVDLDGRAAMTGLFSDALTAAGQSWVLLSGSLEERLDLALRCTALVLNGRLAFAPARDQTVAP